MNRKTDPTLVADNNTGWKVEEQIDGTKLWTMRLIFVLILTLVGSVAPAAVEPPQAMVSAPGQMSLSQAKLPAGIYEVSFRMNIDKRENTVTPLATLAVSMPGYPHVIHEVTTPINFAAANTCQEFTFLFDNFQTQDVQATVTLAQNKVPTPQLTVSQIAITPVPSPRLGTVWPGKILYYTGENARGFVAVYNGSTTPQTVTLRCALESGLDTIRSLPDQTLTIPPGERREVPVTWNTGKEEYGFALVATLMEAGGKQLDQRREYFSVADNVWKVGMTIGGIGSGVPSGPGPNESIPVSQVQQAEAQLAAELAKPPAPVNWSYQNYQEFFAWSPDNYFVQAPAADYWYSGIGNYTMGKRWLKLAVEWLHRRGVRATSYVLPWSGGYGADAVYAQHPDWFVYDKSGQLSWGGYQKKLEVGNQVGGAETPWNLQLAPYALSLSPDIARLETIDAFVNQVVKSQKMLGFDGIRFDTAVFSAVGYDIAGRKIDGDNPKKKDELEVRAWQRMRDSLWRKLGPNFVIGNNEDYELYINNNRAEWEESCRKGCLLMEEVPRSSTSPQSPRNRWRDYLAYYHKTGEIVRGLGGHHLTIAFDLMNPIDSVYLNVLTCAMRSHPYGNYWVDSLPLGNYPQFVTRYSAFLWDVERVKALPDPERQITVTSARPVWWQELASLRQAPNGKHQYILHLINPPVQERIYADPTNQVPAPQTNIQVTLTPAPGEKISRAWLLSADPVTRRDALPLTAGGGQVAVTVPRLDFWSMVVFE